MHLRVVIISYTANTSPCMLMVAKAGPAVNQPRKPQQIISINRGFTHRLPPS